MRYLRKITKILGWSLTVLMGVMLVCNLYIMGARYIGGEQQPDILGFSTAIVISGSMSGSIEVNDMIIIRKTGDYAVGDIITFYSGENLVTHRIVDTNQAGYITRGDANNAPDSEAVPTEQIVGEVIFVVRGVGRTVELLRSPLGLTCLVLGGFLLAELPGILEACRKGKGNV